MNAREANALASVGYAEPPADGTVVIIDGEPWPIRYVSSLTYLGVAGDLDYNGRPVNAIRLRQWNERVFLHEALHVILDQRLQDYHAGPDFDSTEPALTPPREAIVQALEDALWDMGWRWVGDTPLPPADGRDESPAQPPEGD